MFTKNLSGPVFAKHASTFFGDDLKVLRVSPGRSGKTNGIVIEAKIRAGRRRKLFRQETGWLEPNYASVSVI
jgi:hypothetical protein